MSQLADLVDTFRKFQLKYDWDAKETAQNFIDVISDLEWSIVDDIDDVEWSERMEYELKVAMRYFQR